MFVFAFGFGFSVHIGKNRASAAGDVVQLRISRGRVRGEGGFLIYLGTRSCYEKNHLGYSNIKVCIKIIVRRNLWSNWKRKYLISKGFFFSYMY